MLKNVRWIIISINIRGCSGHAKGYEAFIEYSLLYQFIHFSVFIYCVLLADAVQ